MQAEISDLRIPQPPFYYGVDYVGVHVELEGVDKFLPRELKSTGEGWIYVSEFVSVSGEDWEKIWTDPYFTQYREAAIAVKVMFQGKNYLFFPFMWVDKDWALIRGWLNGYPKEIARIEMSKFHPLLPRYSKPEAGVKLGGYVIRGKDALLKVVVELTEISNTPPPSSFGPTLTYRYFPAIGDGSSVREFAKVIKSEGKTGTIWKGRGGVELGGALGEIKVKKVMGGYFYPSFFKIDGTKRE